VSRPQNVEVFVSELFMRVWSGVLHRAQRWECGQSTAEYALVMIAAAAIGGLVLTWAHKTNLVSGLFNSVVHRFLGFL
jgi:hypothetical protein